MTYDIRASSEPESQEKLEVRMNMRKQARFVAVALGLVILAIVVVNTSGQEDVKSSDPVAGEQWEYLAVAGVPTDPVYYFKRQKRTETSR
jgi:hypothetical protein